MTRRYTLVFLLYVAAAPLFAAGLGASDYTYIDAIRVDERTGAVTLVLVIDRPLTDGLTKPKVRSKMLGYQQWVFRDEKLQKLYPQSNVSAGIKLLILHPPAKSALGSSVLEQLVGYARELKFQPLVQPLPDTK
jgi:hypothetical protein